MHSSRRLIKRHLLHTTKQPIKLKEVIIMEEKHTSLVVLGIVVVLAIVGLVMMFQIGHTGKTVAAGRNSMLPYPGGVIAGEYPGTPITETPGAVVTGTDSWRQKRTASIKYGEPIQSCAQLTYVGTVQAGYTEDANYEQAKNRDCIYVEGSPAGFCCRK